MRPLPPPRRARSSCTCMPATRWMAVRRKMWIGPGKLAESSAQQVQRLRTVREALNLEMATPDEARSMLALKGGDRVNF
ncbi:MAG: 3-keto-5-aminohexanoate cleavage protein [Burkholderiales bacterium]|jgi:hypothetical protein|uniref:3-keto-5-aminohexanoate cleavage protein n=1 Tax=Limnohabitans sp. TaxID=1907725 RepID=UPI00345B23AF